MSPDPRRLRAPLTRSATIVAVVATLGACAKESSLTEPAGEVTTPTELQPATTQSRSAYTHPWVGRLIMVINDSASLSNCLDVANAVAVKNQPVNQFPCHWTGGINQQFWVGAMPTTATRTDKSFVYLQSAQNPTLCLDIYNGTAWGGERLQLYPCAFTRNQSFYLPWPTGGVPQASLTAGYIYTENSNLRMVLEAALPLSLRYVQQVAPRWPYGYSHPEQNWHFRDARSWAWL